jgi:solute carrier family 35 protein F1/2
MSAIQPEAQPAAGYYGNKSDVSVERQVDKTGAGVNVSSENEQAGSPAMGNPTLEAVAQTKGRWFQYVKTKQFWITLLLGQGMFLYPYIAFECCTDMWN